MAHATKCAAPESNRGQDEWMTVIEMQEYIDASVARHTTSSGRERSTRTGSTGSSWCRGRPWTSNRVEERQEMTAATAPGAARGRAREGASRRKELEDDHDQEH